jgi:hypothetical protein
MIVLSAKSLSPSAIEVLGQLYVNGPTWDGNVASKAGRGELVERGLAFHAHGYASLTSDGVEMATSWDMTELSNRHNKRWFEKRRQS